ncbi:MAG: hypothetical protein AB7G75_00750 [Candidatus Binatia bacterium]
MKRIGACLGMALVAVLLTAPVFARSLESSLKNTLFGGSQSIFLTVRNPAFVNGSDFPDSLVLLSADRNSQVFGQPIQTSGRGGIASLFSRALGSNILTESAVIPLPSGSAGFEYSYNPALNVFERTSIGLGAIFSERINTLGKGAFALGISYVRQDFDTFNGKPISNLRLNKGLFPGQQSLGPFLDTGIVDAQVNLDIETNTVALYGIYGLTDWLDLSLLLPITDISVRAKSTIRQGSATLLDDFAAFLPDPRCDANRAQSGNCRVSDFILLRAGTRFTFAQGEQVNRVNRSKLGVGDVVIRGKARFLESRWGAFGGLAELTFPTGNKNNFLGDDALKARFLILYSQGFFDGRVNFHLNGGGKITTQTGHKNTFEYGSAVDFLLTQRLSLVAEMIGSWRVDPEGLPRHFLDGAFGFKVNPFAGLIVSASFRIPATDDGLRSDLVYLAGLEYDF